MMDRKISWFNSFSEPRLDNEDDEITVIFMQKICMFIHLFA